MPINKCRKNDQKLITILQPSQEKPNQATITINGQTNKKKFDE